MQFKFYDDVDPEQVNQINLICHNEPADERTLAGIRKSDPFCSPWFRMYAVEGERIIAQVGAQYPRIETAEGEAKAGFIEAVAGTPSFARKGYAKALMKKVHEQMRDDGVDIFALTTSRILVAYDMYPKLGYHDIMGFNWGLKRGAKYPKGDVKVKVARHLPTGGDKLFRELAQGNLGFVRRPNSYPEKKCSWGAHYTKAVSFSREGEPIGYALVRLMEDFLNVRELVCPDLADMAPCLRALENRFPRKQVSRSISGRDSISQRFRDHGFAEGESWGMFMAMDAKGKLSRKQVKNMLGLGRDRFQMFALDTY
jgi:GNAT superfamily N-acetyltransferase